jgi:curved DNA-binding protein CbpA
MVRAGAGTRSKRSKTTRRPAKLAPTHYQILQVHPAAPLDLITAAYWRLVSQIHMAGRSDKAAEVAVYHLTRSYETLANAQSRMEYDKSLGLPLHPGVPVLPPGQRSSWMGSFLPGRPAAEPEEYIDYYELLRLDPAANPGIAAEAYLVMRNYYLRLVEQTGASRELVNRLVEGYEIICDPKKRREYDRTRKAKRRIPSRAGTARSARGRTAAPPTAREQLVESTGVPADEEITTPKAPARRQPHINGHKSAEAGRAGEPAAPPGNVEPLSFKVARSLAAGSASLFEHSFNFARKASKTVRGAIVEDEEAISISVMELTPDEEEALLERLSSVPGSEPSETQPPSSGSGVLGQLSIVEGPGFGRTFDIDAVPLTLGTDDACDITLPGLAAQQARLLHRNGQFVLFSLTDEPKTTIHGNSVAWGVLEDGDSFQVGPYVLKFDSAALTVAGP